MSAPIDQGQLVALSAASANGNTLDFLNNGRASGVLVTINVATLSGTSPTLTVTLQGKDPVSQTYYTILASAAISSTGFSRLTVYPALPATANVSANDILPVLWRVSYAIGGTTPAVTATIGAQLLT